MSKELEESAPPAMWEHVRRTYEGMAKEAKTQSITVEGKSTDVRVYEGFISNLIIEDLGIPVPYYGRVLRYLKRMGCVQQLRRGGGPSPSQWAMFKDPTVDEFFKMLDQLPPEEVKADPLESRVNDVVRLIGGIDVPKAITDLQLQIDALKEKVDHEPAGTGTHVA